MSFVQNGSFEALNAQATANTQNTTSEANPFGLKDFARMLDSKFGNSAFSDNLLSSPQKPTTKSVNPFDKEAVRKLDANDYFDKNNPYTAAKGKTEKVSSASQEDNGHSDAYNTAPASIFGGFNKGTGMAQGGRSRHKLDFCY